MADVLRLYDPTASARPSSKADPGLGRSRKRPPTRPCWRPRAAGSLCCCYRVPLVSPTRKALLSDLKAALPPGNLAMEPAAGDAAEEAAKASCGQAVEIHPAGRRPKVILSLGRRFLNGEDPEALAAWGAKRR